VTAFEACGWSAVRAAAVALPAVWMAGLMTSMLRDERGRESWLLWAMIIAPFVTPGILVGYVYRRTDLSLAQFSLVNELAGWALLWFRLTPAAVLVRCFAPPPPLSAEALHSMKLLGRQAPVATRVSAWLRGPHRNRLVAGALVFLLAFAEFDMTSLLQVRTWTDWMYMRMIAVGLDPEAAIRVTLLPLAIELVVLVAAVALLRGRGSATSAPTQRSAGRAWVAAIVWLYLLVSVIAVTLVPLAKVSSSLVTSFDALQKQWRAWEHFAASLLMALPAALLAWWVATWASRRRSAAIAVALPGLLGPLAVSIVIVSAIQSVTILRDTPLPWLLALVLIIMPVAVLLRLLLQHNRRDEALHSARLLRDGGGRQQRVSRRLLWELRSAGPYWSVWLLFSLAYFDVAAGYLLAPLGFARVSMTPVPAFLYNQMHYGEMLSTSALLAVAVFVPLALALLGAAGRRLVGWSFTMNRQ